MYGISRSRIDVVHAWHAVWNVDLRNIFWSKATLSHVSCNFHEAYRFLWDIFSLSNRRLRGRKRSSKYGARKGSLCTRLEHVLASIPDDTEFIPERRMNFCLHILFSLAKILEIQFPETKMSNRESGRCQEFEISNRKARQIGPSRAEAKIDRPDKSFSTAFNHSVFRSIWHLFGIISLTSVFNRTPRTPAINAFLLFAAFLIPCFFSFFPGRNQKRGPVQKLG